MLGVGHVNSPNPLILSANSDSSGLMLPLAAYWNMIGNVYRNVVSKELHSFNISVVLVLCDVPAG